MEEPQSDRKDVDPLELGRDEDGQAEGDRPGLHGRRWFIGFALVAVILAGVVLVVWQPWNTGSCIDDEHHVIDEKSKLCYVLPDGWTRVSEEELAEEAEEDGWYMYTSRILDPDGDEQSAWVEVSSSEPYLLGDTPSGDDLEELARWLATGSEAMSIGDPEVVSETLRIGDHDAATATAQVLWFLSDGDRPSIWLWRRVTVVKIGDEASVMFFTTLGNKDELESEEGIIETLDLIHDSIEVRP
jgi:hypothetical protein